MIMTTNVRRIVLLVSMVLCMGLIATACSTPPVEEIKPEGELTMEPEEEIEPEGELTIEPEEEIKPEGELIIALPYAVEVFDPSLGPSNGRVHQDMLYDYLVGSTIDGELSKELGLAKDWKEEHFDTHTELTFYLREGVKWHNGDEVIAEDVKLSLEHYMRPLSVSSYSGFLRNTIDQIEIVDRYTLKITTKEPSGVLLMQLSRIFGGEGMVLPGRYIQEIGAENFNLASMGSGPYRAKELEVGSQIIYEAVPGEHWLWGAPKYETVTLKIVPEESTALAMLQQGEANIIAISREAVKGVPDDFALYMKEGAFVIEFRFEQQWEEGSYFADRRVRQALSLAINREEMLENLLADFGEITGQAMLGTWDIAFEPGPPYVYDPEEAKRLLNEAFPEGVKIRLAGMDRFTENRLVAEAVLGYWEEVGVEVDFWVVDYATYRPLYGTGELSNTAYIGPLSNRPIWGLLIGLLHGSSSSLTSTKDAYLDSLLEEFRSAIEIDEVIGAEREASSYLNEEFLAPSLFEIHDVFAANPQEIPHWDMGKLLYDLNLLSLVTSGQVE